MRKFTGVFIAVTALLPILAFVPTADALDSTEWSYTAIATDTSKSIDVSPYYRFSAQAVYADGTPSTMTLITSGQQSTATLTVTRNDVGTAKRPWLTITVSSQGTTGILTGAVITLNNRRFVQGTHWNIGASSVATAKSISDAIDATAQYRATYTFAGADWAVISASFTETGTLHNGYAASVSTVALTLSASTFTGGEANGVIHIGSMTLTHGTHWTDSTTAALTAKAISNAILANMGTLFRSTFSSNVIYASSTINGSFNYPIDGPSGLTIAGPGFMNGRASDINLATDRITKASHGLSTGMMVWFATTSPNMTPGGLANGATYWAIANNLNTFQLSDTSSGSVAGIAVDISSVPLIVASTYTIVPVSLSPGPGTGFYWTFSNDNVNFSTYAVTNTNVSSVTYSGSGNTVWDFGVFQYKYLKLNAKGPISGAISLFIRLFGKRD
jgi:hypothetical protein